MCMREDAKTTELEPTGKHGVLHSPVAAHDKTTAHDTTAHDTTSHDTATSTKVRRYDDAKSTIHRRP